MLKRRHSHKLSQEEIFSSYNWWDKSCLLYQITAERGDYIESCVNRVLGKGALPQQEVLEIGCGGGLICNELARRGAWVAGVDPADSALEVARENLHRSGLAQHSYFERGYAEALPYADGSFSVIVCMDVLEHVHDLHATLKEIARVLAPGGVFIFDTINRTWMARLALIWIGERFFQKSGLLPGLHNYHDFIKPAELQEAIHKHNLDVQELVGFMPRIMKGRLSLGTGWFKGVSYVGYATKAR